MFIELLIAAWASDQNLRIVNVYPTFYLCARLEIEDSCVIVIFQLEISWRRKGH
jgi:hypothetical protein